MSCEDHSVAFFMSQPLQRKVIPNKYSSRSDMPFSRGQRYLYTLAPPAQERVSAGEYHMSLQPPMGEACNDDDEIVR